MSGANLHTYEVSVKGTDWTRLIDAATPGKAKYAYLREIREAWQDTRFTALTCRRLRGPKPPTRTQIAQREADAFNAVHPIGTLVNYWSGLKEGPPTGTGEIYHPATVLCEHAVAWIKGARSCHSVTHVESADRANAASPPNNESGEEPQQQSKAEEGLG